MSTPSAETVSIIDLRSVLRLVGDLKDLPDGSGEQRRLALEGLSRLLGAKVALWIEINRVEDGIPVLECPIDLGWGTGGERAVFRYYMEHQREPVDPAVPRLAGALVPPRATLTRADVIHDRDWYGSEHVQDFRRAACVDSFMCAMRLSARGGISTIALHRPWNDRPFSPRERAILDAFSSETPWLDAPQGSPVERLDLSPRIAAVLHGLLRGLSEKEVAAELGLSPHTTHDYVKTLYRKLGVRSRAELLARSITPGPRAALKR